MEKVGENRRKAHKKTTRIHAIYHSLRDDGMENEANGKIFGILEALNFLLQLFNERFSTLGSNSL